jgi:hypothetical protein
MQNVGSPMTEASTTHLFNIHKELIFLLHETQDQYKDYANHRSKFQLKFKIGDCI